MVGRFGHIFCQVIEEMVSERLIAKGQDQGQQVGRVPVEHAGGVLDAGDEALTLANQVVNLFPVNPQVVPEVRNLYPQAPEIGVGERARVALGMF